MNPFLGFRGVCRSTASAVMNLAITLPPSVETYFERLTVRSLFIGPASPERGKLQILGLVLTPGMLKSANSS
jgi:hypothetical protein